VGGPYTGRHQIDPACEAALVEFAQWGYAGWRAHGYAAINQARNEMTAAALADSYEERHRLRHFRVAGGGRCPSASSASGREWILF
jgi:hypothetical protein